MQAVPFCDEGMSMPGMSMSPMRMAFPTSDHPPCSTVLVEGWVINSRAKQFFAFFASAAAGIVHELLVFLRISLRISYSKAQPAEQQLLLNRRLFLIFASLKTSDFIFVRSYKTVRWVGTTMKVVDSVLYAVTVGMGYVLMLVSMSYDYSVFLGMVFGYAVGYYFFGDRKPLVINMESLFNR